MSDTKPSQEHEILSDTFYRASAKDFRHLPASPIAYWLPQSVLDLYKQPDTISDIANVGIGLQTGDNEAFIRLWHEVSAKSIGFDFSDAELAKQSFKKWFPCNKGGEYQKWYGNQHHIINWEADGRDIKQNTPSAVIRNERTYFKPVVAWSKVTSGKLVLRYFPNGFIHNDASGFLFTKDRDLDAALMAIINSNITTTIFSDINPTLNFVPGQVRQYPFPKAVQKHLEQLAFIGKQLIDATKDDWDSSETSWGFSYFPLIEHSHKNSTLPESYRYIRELWSTRTTQVMQLEKEGAKLVNLAYNLQDVNLPQIPWNEITLHNNPRYRYRRQKGKEEDELEAMMLTETMKDLISYAVGCMLGRYSIDESGLILASQGESLEDYLKRVPEPTFYPTQTNVLPVIGGGWFADDITEQFREFLKVTFGDEHYEENLEFIEKALNTRNRRHYSIEDYFLKEFYNDHVSRYQKRPIYWLFSSPKGSFNALIYMHRYNVDTISILLNEYLREFQTKLLARKASLELISTSSRDSSSRTQAIKELEETNKILSELDNYERDIIFPLATEKIEIDLDDGVKANYPKFGEALKKVAGL